MRHQTELFACEGGWHHRVSGQPATWLWQWQMPRPKGDTVLKAALSGTGHKVLIGPGQFYHRVYKTNPK